MDDQIYAGAREAYNQIRPLLQEAAEKYGLELVEWYHDEWRWLLLRNGVETFSIDIQYLREYSYSADRESANVLRFEITGMVLENDGLWHIVFGSEGVSAEKVLKQKGPYQFEIEIRVSQKKFRSLLTEAIDQTIQYVREKRK